MIIRQPNRNYIILAEQSSAIQKFKDYIKFKARIIKLLKLLGGGNVPDFVRLSQAWLGPRLCCALRLDVAASCYIAAAQWANKIRPNSGPCCQITMYMKNHRHPHLPSYITITKAPLSSNQSNHQISPTVRSNEFWV